MKKGQMAEGIITEYTFPNKGSMVFYDEQDIRGQGSRITVKGALPGQRIRCRITKKRNNRAEGKLLEVIEKGHLEDAVPSCPHFVDGACGGCTYQTMSYSNQLKLKEDLVRGLIDSVTTDYVWEGIQGSPVTEGYRNKMEFSFGDEYKGGPLALGLHKKGSFHDIVNVTDCSIVTRDVNEIVKFTREFYSRRQVPFYHKMTHEGVLRHLVVRQSAKSGELLVNLVATTQGVKPDSGEGDFNFQTRKPDFSERDFNFQKKKSDFSEGDIIFQNKDAESENADALDLEAYKNGLLSLPLEGKIVGILFTKNDSLSDAVQCDEMQILYGQDYFIEEVLGLRFKITPFSFFQTNTLSAEVLYQTVRSYVGEIADATVFDLYSGTGTIAQLMAPVAKRVIGVEIVEEAVISARENALANGLSNCEFIAGDVLKVLDTIEEKPDMIVLDPPRDGIHPKALRKIIDYGVERLVYVSCKPTSLVRDLEIFLGNGYRLEKACAVDQFVGTVHVESIVLLSHKNLTA